LSSASIRDEQVVRLAEQIDAQVVNITLSFGHFLAIGGVALAIGFAAGFRLNIAAIFVISVVAAVVTFATTLGFGVAVFSSAILAVAAILCIQIGYFAGILIRPRSREASSRESITAQKSNSR
jgi:lysylphosphatidylglycerol synthetase-like protein (DUF2156 family)